MSKNAIVTNEMYNESQVKLVKDMYAKNFSDDELKLMLYMSEKYGLDVLTKQIWGIKFGSGAAQIYAGRDGFLEIAHKSGQFNGMDTKIKRIEEGFEVRYTTWENNKKVEKTFKTDYQYVATCTVFRKDMEHPITVEVYEEEYSTGQNLWTSKRRTMIGKVAESQALRKAFSISGIYSPEEMGQWEAEQQSKQHEKEPTKKEEPKVSQSHISALIAKATQKGDDNDALKAKLKNAYGIESENELTIKQFTSTMKAYDRLPDVPQNPQREPIDVDYTEVDKTDFSGTPLEE